MHLIVASPRKSRMRSNTWQCQPSLHACGSAGILACMLSIIGNSRALRLCVSAVGFAFMLLHAPCAGAWGNHAHRMINRLAASSLPADVPEFLRSETALNEIEYLGPEPDRWRSVAEPELGAAQAPEHFIDLDAPEVFAPLPRRRFDYEARLFATGNTPERAGLLPWQTIEVWERLKGTMRQYRVILANHGDTAPVEQAIVFYAGWLGHYVADGSQPLHTTLNFNGWVGPNPNGYTTGHKIHSQFETEFVANLNPSEVQARMTPLKPIDGDMFDAYLSYLRHTHASVEEVYKFEKAGGFTRQGTQASRDFTTERLAAGASMLRDMIYSAWLESANLFPDPYAGK